MHEVLLGLGSNINRQENIRSGIAILRKILSEFRVSPVYESPSVGFDGSPFFNLVVYGTVNVSLSELATRLREIECSHGREKNAKKFSPRQLDIDILSFDDQVGVFERLELPRDEILQQAFVLKPLVDLVPEKLHPKMGLCYSELWQSFTGDKRNLWQADFQITDADS